MGKKIIIISLFFLLFFSFFSLNSLAQPAVCDWRGYVSVSGSLANSSYVITVANLNSSQVINGTLYDSGYYIVHVPGLPGNMITFNVSGVYASANGVLTNTTPITWSCTSPGYNILNLSMSPLANGNYCTYALGCIGGYCNSGICASSAPTTTTSSAAGGGGGGSYIPPSSSTTTVTSTTAPPVTETETISNASAGSTVQLNITNSSQLKINQIQITLNNSVSNVNIQIQESSAPSANVAISSSIGAVYKYLQITKTNIQDSNIASVKIKFQVEKSWLSTNGIDVNTIALSRLVENTWTNLPTVKSGEDSTYVYFEATSPGLSLFAIIGQKLVMSTSTTIPPITTSTTTPKILPQPTNYTYLWIIIFIIIVILISYFGLKKFRVKTAEQKVLEAGV